MSVRRRTLPLAAVGGAAKAIAVTGAIAFMMASCGGGSSSTPTTTLAPTPSPTPTPLGAGSYNDVKCSLGKGELAASTTTCVPASSSLLLGDVQTAMDTLLKQKPQLFDTTSEASPGTGTYKVVDREGYMQGVVFTLRSMGLCSERDFDDALQQTVRVKSSNTDSEDFAVIDENGFIQRAKKLYTQTCTPAAFPVDRPTDSPPLASGCHPPYPPVVSRIDCKIHLKGKPYYTLDSTPKVGPNVDYCLSIGSMGQSICTIRLENVPDRLACENWRVGVAKDTGRPGPTWTKGDGSYCTGPESSCQNSVDNQYQLWTYVGGTYVVVGQTGSSCTVSY